MKKGFNIFATLGGLSFGARNEKAKKLLERKYRKYNDEFTFIHGEYGGVYVGYDEMTFKSKNHPEYPIMVRMEHGKIEDSYLTLVHKKELENIIREIGAKYFDKMIFVDDWGCLKSTYSLAANATLSEISNDGAFLSIYIIVPDIPKQYAQIADYFKEELDKRKIHLHHLNIQSLYKEMDFSITNMDRYKNDFDNNKDRLMLSFNEDNTFYYRYVVHGEEEEEDV